MLQPFLFIGVGGSGGKTLRTLKADLAERLLEVSYAGPLPSCWQFLHIDVPTVADGNEPDLPEQLDEKDYVGLVRPGIDYATIDNALTANADESVVRNLLGWRPEPRRVSVPVARGAGQYRALGRAIALTNLDAISHALKRALAALHGPKMLADLAAVSRAFGVSTLVNPPDPQAVVVSSLAGGSGSGSFVDICDLLRAIGNGGGGWTGEAFGLLYAPDVFASLPEDKRAGVNANALAALCELLAGFWDSDPRTDDFAIMQSRGIATGALNRRGPRFPLIIGAKNERVGFDDQNAVYRAMGKALAAWVVSENLQNQLKAHATGNWQQSAQLPDATQLRLPDQEQPLCSIGFGRVGLGRDRFASYASERLARRAVERILREHLADRAADADPNHEAAIEERVTAALAAFLDRSGLDERGADRNQILDAIRPTDRKDRLNDVTETIRDALVSGRTDAVTQRQWLAEAIELLREHQRRFADVETARRNERAREWAGDLQARLEGLVAESIARFGAPVTDRLLGRLRGELQAALTELADEEAKYRNWQNKVDELVSGVLQPTNDAVFGTNPLISQALSKGVDCFAYLAEADLHQFVALLVKDLLSNLVEPLHVAVRAGRDYLHAQEAGTRTNPSIVESWPSGDIVPRRYQPAANEFLLEPADSYPSMFREFVTRSARVKDPGGAELEFVRDAIVGSAPTDPQSQTAVYASTKWVPGVPGIQTDFGVSARAQFELRISPQHLLERCRSLVQDPQSAIGSAVAESLHDYLSPALGKQNVEPAELERRADAFRDAFVQALQTSAPLVNVAPRALLRVHEQNQTTASFLFTEIPFPDGSTGYKIVREVLEARHEWTGDVAKAFSEGRQSRIDVFSMLTSAYSPVVFESIVGPIADEWARRRTSTEQRDAFWKWKRARPLPTFLPLGPEVRLAMVRGWFTARLLDAVKWDARSERDLTMIWDDDAQAFLPFPHPTLGHSVFEEYERLPAVLESLPIALVEFAECDNDALRPYLRLRDYGTDGRGAIRSYSIASCHLDEWVRAGRVPAGAPTPAIDRAGSTGDTPDAAHDRRDRCLRTVSSWQELYGEKLSEPVTLNNFFETPRVVEIRDDLLTALRDLEGAIGRISLDDNGADW